MIDMILRAIFVMLLCLAGYTAVSAEEKTPRPLKAVYFGSNAYGTARTGEVLRLLEETEVNAVVLDYKDDYGHVFSGDTFRRIALPFKEKGAFILCRIVTFKITLRKDDNDNYRIPSHVSLDLLLKSRSPEHGIWRGDKGKSIYLNPALPAVREYIVSVAERAIDDGCQELNFDYIRFPDGPGLSNILLPVANGSETKWPYLRKTMREFMRALAQGIRKKSPSIPYSADIFGYAAISGEPGIGQYVEDFAEHGFGLYGMFYPSHYRCKEFGGVLDPNTDPYRVYFESVKAQLRRLKKHGYTNVTVRPWLQGFSIANIYDCGSIVQYHNDFARFNQQIRGFNAARTLPDFKDMNVHESWIVWNPSALYNPVIFNKRKRP